jgi:hypothetical protein
MPTSSRAKLLRASSLAVSICLYSAFLALLLSEPIKSLVASTSREDLIMVRAIAGGPNPPAQKIAPKKQIQLTEARKEPQLVIQKPNPPTLRREVADKPAPNALAIELPVLVEAIEVETDIVARVREMLKDTANREPLDFRNANSGAMAAFSSLLPSTAEGAADACATTQGIQADLGMDLSLRAALKAIPRNQRSVANVVMVWDGAWIEPQNSPDDLNAAPAILKSRLQELIRNLPAPCANGVVQGPAFILIDDEAEPTILAIGSGTWHWVDLLAEDEPVLVTSNEALSAFDTSRATRK